MLAQVLCIHGAMAKIMRVAIVCGTDCCDCLLLGGAESAGSGHEHEEGGLAMNRLVSLAFLAAGVLLVIFGISASKSLGSDISRFFTGSPTDKAIWMLIGGVVLGVIGLVGLLRGSRSD